MLADCCVKVLHQLKGKKNQIRQRGTAGSLLKTLSLIFLYKLRFETNENVNIKAVVNYYPAAWKHLKQIKCPAVICFPNIKTTETPLLMLNLAQNTTLHDV